jgi:hypothetical protein
MSADILALPLTYRLALDALADAVRDAAALAEVLDQFAGVLRGKRPGLEGPPVELYPTPYRVRQALERVDAALDHALDTWDRLSAELREGLPRPRELMEDLSS